MALPFSSTCIIVRRWERASKKIFKDFTSHSPVMMLKLDPITERHMITKASGLGHTII
jgi:hypothetical protein